MRRAGKQMQLPHVSKTTPSCFNQERSVVFFSKTTPQTSHAQFILNHSWWIDHFKAKNYEHEPFQEQYRRIKSCSNESGKKPAMIAKHRSQVWLHPRLQISRIHLNFIWLIQNQLQKAIPAYWARPTRQRVWPKIFRREQNSTNPPPKTFWLMMEPSFEGCSLQRKWDRARALQKRARSCMFGLRSQVGIVRIWMRKPTA